MSWPTGIRLLASMSFQEKEYNLIVLKQNDMGIVTWFVRVVEGVWQIPWETQTSIALVGFPDRGDVEALMTQRLVLLNKSLMDYFGDAPPATFAEILESALIALKLTLTSGIPQISR